MAAAQPSISIEGSDPRFDGAPITRFGSTEAGLIRAMLPASPDRDDAWRQFQRQYGRQLFGFIRSMAGDLGLDVCDDLYEDVIIKIDRGLENYDHRRDGGFLAWCRVIAANRCIDERRVAAGHPKHDEFVSYDEVEQQLVAKTEEDASSLAVPEVGPLSDNERRVGDAFGQLSATDQAIIWLHFVESLTDAEIAARLQKPYDNVRKLREKALTRLERKYGKKRVAQRRRI
jgi:RNA polymerase sigma factor (sigma-70 family)